MFDVTRLPFLVFVVLIALSAACDSRVLAPDEADDRFLTWKRYEGEPGATSFSAHDQINRDNVDQLEIAWTYSTPGVGDLNPIVADTFMFVVGEDDAIVALHAATGRELWSHESPVAGSFRGHGLMYWESDDGSERRVLFQKGGYSMMALDAFTGEPVASFGEDGVLDLRPGLSTDPALVARATSPSPGVIFEDLVILGSSPGEGYVAGPGHIRAFNVRTGAQEWIFHTLPKPGEYGYDTWPEGRSDDAGGANAWGGMSVDPERGIVFVPLGSANYDFYGVDRHGENLFANSLVALDARTGERLWHFQTVHHDLWDYDLTATPVLLTVERDSAMVDIVALATKTGFVFAFERETGESLWPIEERPVPASDMPGEAAWPTQPYPTRPEPFVPQAFDVEQDFNPHLDPADRDSLYELISGMLNMGMFTPPSTRPTMQIPGNRGGANWGSTAGDPRDGTFYVVGYNMPSILHLLPITAGATGTGGSAYDSGQSAYIESCQICHGANLEGQPMGGIPPLKGVMDRMSHVEFEEVVRSGRATMPAFPQLSEREFTGLQMYLSNPEMALVPGPDPVGVEGGTSLPPGDLRYQSGWVHLLDSKGLPAIKPPWFRITAYDMNEGTVKWQVPVGEVDHLVEQGIEGTGASAWLRGGPAVTAGGLLFQAVGNKLRAFDIENGEEVWVGTLPANSEGIPAVYAVDGRQYIALSAPGAMSWLTASADSSQTPGYVAFALPESVLDD